MARVALIETKQSKTDYIRLFDNEFEFDRFALSSDPYISKVLKKDVDLVFDPDKYEWVILVGSEPLKFFTKVTQIMQYAGSVVDDKFLPTINPAMLKFKPEAKKIWDDSKNNILAYISGDLRKAEIGGYNFVGIEDTNEAINYIQLCIDAPLDYTGIDTETTGLYPRNGYIMGISLCYAPDTGCYINADCIDELVEEKLQELFNKKRMVFHNAKFDIPMLEYHFNFNFPRFEDTMLMHYVIDENPGTHGLKFLAMKYTNYGDYEKPMYAWMDQYRKEHGVLKNDFKWEWIPFDIMKNYAAIDACATLMIFEKFEAALKKGNSKLMKVYRTILLPASSFLQDVQDNGVPFSRERLSNSQMLMTNDIYASVAALHEYKDVQRFEERQSGKEFNPNSVKQLRELLYDFLGLPPTGIKTAKGENSTNAEVLKAMSSLHEVPKLILEIRQKTKIKNTYLDKIIPQLDRDSRLRTNFNIHGTTSGRLSSSGKLNMQQLPRDNPIIKGCIRADEGRKIVAMDLTTAEVYVAAVLSGDLELQEVFKQGGNFHSTIAKKVFRLDCPVESVADLWSSYRQASKAVTFGIMFGAGPATISEQVIKDGGQLSVAEAADIIDEYFASFSRLKQWIDDTKSYISINGSIYSHFGRKRRLPEAIHGSQKHKSHAIRSGMNFVIQSVASDINLLGGIDANSQVKTKGIDAKIFALVHDSILADVADDHIDDYSSILLSCIQQDRGIYIPGTPIGCDFEIHQDYSIGKFEKVYGSSVIV